MPERYRNQGIGSALMERVLAWMDGGGAIRKGFGVGNNNEEAWKFYKKFGLYPRMTIFEQKREDEAD